MTKATVYKQVSSLVIGVCIMPFLTSCSGESKSATNKSSPQKNPYSQELGLEGRYTVKFDGLNSSVAGNPHAEAKIQVVADKVAFAVNVKDSAASTTHATLIYSGTECPSEIHDTNSDGFIDPVEASEVLGQVLIPLDGDLNSQEQGLDNFPTTDFLGSLSYYKEGELSLMLADLKAPDSNVKDELAKLEENQELSLDGKVMVIQGVASDVYLPGSIRAFEGVSDRASLSIACGKISRTMIDEFETGEGQIE